MENSLFSGVPKFRQSTASLQCAWILGPLKNINFPFQTNGKLMILGVPILKHLRVTEISCKMASIFTCHFLSPRFIDCLSRLIKGFVSCLCPKIHFHPTKIIVFYGDYEIVFHRVLALLNAKGLILWLWVRATYLKKGLYAVRLILGLSLLSFFSRSWVAAICDT